MGYRGWVPVQKRVISIRDRDYLAGSDKRTNDKATEQALQAHHQSRNGGSNYHRGKKGRGRFQNTRGRGGYSKDKDKYNYHYNDLISII